MRVGAWTFWLSCFCFWAEQSEPCSCQPRPRLDERSKARVKGHVRHGAGGNKHEAHHRYRKGTRVHAEETPPRIIHQPSDVAVRAGFPARLSCQADGNPKPTISWLHNGQPLETEKRADKWQTMILPDGSLFFLIVGGDRIGDTQEGFYACVAENSAGKAISRNASLCIAVLKDEFLLQPGDVEVAEGEVTVLNCSPPMGRPEPDVTWKKDGLFIDDNDPHYTEGSRKLIIAPTEKKHSGSYVCVASNTAGVRESRAARLSVLAKPVLLLKPENVSVKTGESAHFYCQAKGDPPPAVVWGREQGPLPNGRYLVNPDQTLQIHYVTAEDAGKYTCTAANDAGVITATAELFIEKATSMEQKDLHKELSALRVALENVTIIASGSNISRVQWKLQSLPAQTHYLDGFEVLYRSLLPISSDWAAKKVMLPSFQTLVGPLKRGFKHEFKVRPYGSNLYGRESNTRHLRVPEIEPSASPLAVSVAVSREQNNTIHLSWEPPPHETHNGIIQGYQVWCVESEEQQFQNWTVDGSQNNLDISDLKPGKQYWVSVAAVNGAGIGKQSDPHGIFINAQIGGFPQSNSQSKDVSQVVAVFQNPVLIGSMGALLWCILMATAVYFFRRHSRTGHLIPGRGKSKGLRRLASEDLIIKHRMAAPDSPWISGSWRPGHFSEKYQDLWAQGHKQPGIRSTSLPISAKTDSRCLDSAVPIVTDSCGVYGTFYVDLMGNGLKTFNSPRHCPKMPHGPCLQQDAETIQIYTQPVSKASFLGSHEVLPWKQAIRPQPKMGLLRESREKNKSKPELCAVNSVPNLPLQNQAYVSPPCRQRLSNIPSGQLGGHPQCSNAGGCPRTLLYSTSLHLVDMLPTAPQFPTDGASDSHSITSDEGSSHSTKVTLDLGSLQSMCAVSGHRGPQGPDAINNRCPSYSRFSTASYATSLDEYQDATLTSQEVTQYLELSPRPDTRSITLQEQHPVLSQSFSPSLGYISVPPVSCTQLEDTAAAAAINSQAPPIGLRQARIQSSPSSCYSEWDGALWNTWSSVTDGNMASARSSLISSVDSCYTNDSANVARFLAAAADSMSGASLSDFSPPASPLSTLYPCFRGESDPFGDFEPTWDWNMFWAEEMEAQRRARYGGRNT